MVGQRDTVYTTLKPIWIFCLVFGIHCYDFSSKSLCFRNSLKLFQKYFHVAIAFASGIFLFYKEIITTKHLGGSSVIQEADVHFRSLGNIFSMIATILFGCRQQDNLIRAIKQMHEIEKKLNKLSSSLSYKMVTLFIVYQLGLMLILSSIHVALYCYKYRIDQGYAYAISSWFIYFTPVKISQIHMIEFCTLILILKQQLHVINSILKEIKEDYEKTNDLKRLLILKQIKKLHSDITQVCREVNNIFSVPLLMKFLCEFVIIFTTIHYFIAGYTFKSEIGRKTLINYYITTVIGHLPFYEIVVIMIVCECICNEHKSTGKLINLVRISTYRDCSKAVVIYLNNANVFLITLNPIFLDFQLCLTVVASEIEYYSLWIL